MTSWTHFALYLSLIYVLYYSLNLAFDLLRARGNTAGEQHTVFELTQQSDPIDASEIITHDYPEQDSQGDLLSSGPISASGGVSLESLFTLAAEDAILFTRQIAA